MPHCVFTGQLCPFISEFLTVCYRNMLIVSSKDRIKTELGETENRLNYLLKTEELPRYVDILQGSMPK